MFVKKAGWAAALMLVVGAGSAYIGCTSVHEEVNQVLLGGTGGTPCTSECCVPEDDCPPTENPCVVPACTPQGACGTLNLTDGTPVPGQPVSDCKNTVCDGNGGTKEVLEATGTACTVGGGKVCTATGQCVGCNTDADCASPTPLCIGQMCVSETCIDGDKNGTETDEDCGGDCPPCMDGKDCKQDGDCASDVCKGSKCQPPACNDGKKNGQEGDVDCGAVCMDQCGPGKGCNQDTDCTGEECSGVNGTCTPNCMDGVQNNQEVGADCGGGACPGCPIGGPCAGLDANCAVGAYCENNACAAKKAPGASCADTKECLAGVCEPTDKVCCDQVCSGTCKSCKLGESPGTCLDVPAEQDPENECTDPETCNGNGVCKKPNGTACDNGGECVSEFCVDSVCCGSACAGACFACNLGPTGVCMPVPKGMEDPGTCDDTNEACGASGDGCVDPMSLKKFGEACTMNNECFSGHCRGAQCKLAIGAPCTEATKDNCVSYRCVNNLCATCATVADCPGTTCTGLSYCSYPTGHPCNGDPQCSSVTCKNDGTCQ